MAVPNAGVLAVGPSGLGDEDGDKDRDGEVRICVQCISTSPGGSTRPAS